MKELLKNFTLEVSLKPFYSLDQECFETVARQIFTHWRDSIDLAETVSILFWSSDGSEILDYQGDMDAIFEWAKYIGGANPRMGWDQVNDPKRINLHATYYDYRDNPPEYTYADLRRLLKTVRDIGREITGKPIKLGATFDPGPEFAKSSFKYERHNEICFGESMGKSSMVCCYALLNADEVKYAGFPNGIPQDTHFGTFLGRQSQCFMRDLGFDYLWLSNGFGFGTETWGLTGAIFNKLEFNNEKIPEVQLKILQFWQLFRQECDYPVETRGTNQSLGIDYGTDAVNHKGIYEGGFDISPPCNSPWAAINGDFGMELVGHLSRIAKLPEGKGYPFRFYVHDPWWVNSPWIDRYERQPHDIYLPLSITRFDETGTSQMPSQINLLTIDNSFGQMPQDCPIEIQPHINKALNRFPDNLPPVLWVYPFDEYSTSGNGEKTFFEDMFMRSAVNQGFPIGGVISTDNFTAYITSKMDSSVMMTNNKITSLNILPGSVIVTPMPLENTIMAELLPRFINEGGQVILYGSLQNADGKLLEYLGIDRTEPLSGLLELEVANLPDKLAPRTVRDRIEIEPVLADGGAEAILADYSLTQHKILAIVSHDGKRRVFATAPKPVSEDGSIAKGRVVWVRGSNSGYFTEHSAGLEPYAPDRSFQSSSLLRYALAEFGINIRYHYQDADSKTPVVNIHRNKNAFIFTGYCPDTTVSISLNTPIGAPLMIGHEGKLRSVENGGSQVQIEYNFSRAWQFESRVFISGQATGIVSCREMAPVSYFMHRRIRIDGLISANLIILPETEFIGRTEVLVNPQGPIVVGELHETEEITTPYGPAILINNVSGTVVVSNMVNELP